jgi:hypothetical protein
MADVTVKLAVGNFSVEVTGEAAYVDKKIDELVSRFLSSSWKASVGEPTASSAVATELSGKKMSAAEFAPNICTSIKARALDHARLDRYPR